MKRSDCTPCFAVVMYTAGTLSLSFMKSSRDQGVGLSSVETTPFC